MAKSRSKNAQNKYQAYKTEQRWLKNRRTKLEKLALKHPNNEDITKALKNLKYRRKTPKSPHWSKTAIAKARLLKEVEGKFNPKELYKERVVLSIISKETHRPEKEHKDPKNLYSLSSRAHTRQGEYPWVS